MKLSSIALAISLALAAEASTGREPVHGNGVVRVRAHRMAKHHRSSAMRRQDSQHSRRRNDSNEYSDQSKKDQTAQAQADQNGDDSKKSSYEDGQYKDGQYNGQSGDGSSKASPAAAQATPSEQSDDKPTASSYDKPTATYYDKSTPTYYSEDSKATPTPDSSSSSSDSTPTPSRSVAGANAEDGNTTDEDTSTSSRDRTTMSRMTRTRDSASAATADSNRNMDNKSGMMNGKSGKSGMMNGQKKEGENKAPAATAAAKAGDAAAAGGGSAASLSAALASQKAGQDAGFSSSSSALAAKFTAASDNNFKGKGSSKVSQDSLCVDKSQVAIASFDKGNPAVGQANSATSKNNFINFCATKQVPLMNGLQQRQLSCNPIPMGMIVPVQQAPTVKWKFPTNGATVPANKNITLELNVKNMVTGVFTDAQGTYFSAPQDVDKSGLIIGHSHFVVNEVNGCADTEPADPTKFVLFKGIDTAAVDGVLSFTAINGFPPGSYQACSMMSSANHQPVLVSLAQRKNQDDCICFQTK